jgi:hypothetical protein
MIQLNLGMGAADAFDALVYPQAHVGTIQYLQNQYNNISQTITEHGRMFVDKAREAFEQYNSSAAMNFARRAVASVQSYFQVDAIMYLDSLVSLQKAQLTMQRWNMANVAVRTKYLNQQCDGYSETYVNVDGGVVGEKHYDWRRVNDGLMHIDSEGTHYFKQYDDYLKDGDKDLTHFEKIDILHTWNKLDYYMALGDDDPTSSSGGKL